MVRITELVALADHKLWLKFEDGTEGELNLNHLVGKGVFTAWESEVSFHTAYINAENGAIAWSDELEIDPYSAYSKIKKGSFPGILQ